MRLVNVRGQPAPPVRTMAKREHETLHDVNCEQAWRTSGGRGTKKVSQPPPPPSVCYSSLSLPSSLDK